MGVKNEHNPRDINYRGILVVGDARAQVPTMSILDKFLVAAFWFLAMLGIADVCIMYGPWWP